MNKQEYQEYLQSDHWKELKKKKRNKAKVVRCAICASQDRVDVHHLLYKNIYDVKTEDLRFLCRRCHDITHEVLQQTGIKEKIKGNNSHHSIFAITKNAVLQVINPKIPKQEKSPIPPKPKQTQPKISKSQKKKIAKKERSKIKSQKYMENKEKIVQFKQLLLSMGFSSYEDYLQSPLWKGIREQVYKRDDYLCKRCEDPCQVVHHWEYSEEVMKGKDFSKLVSLCHECHDWAEFLKSPKGCKYRFFDDIKGTKEEKFEDWKSRREMKEAKIERVRVLILKDWECILCKQTKTGDHFKHPKKWEIMDICLECHEKERLKRINSLKNRRDLTSPFC